MDQSIVHQIVEVLFSYFETADTQSAAIRLFLKEKGIATDEELAPYLKQAANGSSVRWRAARARVNFLLSSAMKAEADGEKPATFKEEPQGAQPVAPEGKDGQAKPPATQDPNPEENRAQEEKAKERPAKS